MWKDRKARKTLGFESKNLGLNICYYLLIKCEVGSESGKCYDVSVRIQLPIGA